MTRKLAYVLCGLFGLAMMALPAQAAHFSRTAGEPVETGRLVEQVWHHHHHHGHHHHHHHGHHHHHRRHHHH